MNTMGTVLNHTWIILMFLSLTEANIVTHEFIRLKPGENITGHVGSTLLARSHQECALRCLSINDCFAYHYKKVELGNCIIIQRNCSDAEKHTFQNDIYSVFFKKENTTDMFESNIISNPPNNWVVPEAVFYQSFDNPDGLVLMEGTNQVGFVPLVAGKVISALSLDHKKGQWVDCGVHTDACMTRPETCGATGGAISVWINYIDTCDEGGIVTSIEVHGGVSEGSGLQISCSSAGLNFRIILADGYFAAGCSQISGWTHIVLNYIGPNDNEGIRIYYDGTEVANKTLKVSESHSAGDGRIVVGRFWTDFGLFYASVQIDELMYFNHALRNDVIYTLKNIA